ncbi:MAG TPA: cellulose synthase operon protein YhjQ/BcsQ [Terracidiphilus sp.]|nr:cellulose synthase operon protein YhjQ/BcsQ [Terracidiphilus sp.]
MTNRKPLSEETPEDVATLYSWANLHGAKYRDFSASRAQTREKARQRVQEAIEADRLRAEQDEAERIEAAQAMEAERQALAQAREDAERAEREAEERVAQLAAQQRAWQAPQTPYSAATYPNPYPAPAPAFPAPYSAPAQGYYPPQQQAQQYPGYAQQQPGYSQQQPYAAPPLASREENRLGWTPAPETGSRPAWLASDRDLQAPPAAHPLEDTLQGSRDRITSRWFALKGIFSAAPAAPEQLPAQSVSRAPVLAVFSLAGGVGKTSLVATLGRALSARGERVLLVDTAAYGLLPFFFGARDQRPGVLRTFTPPGTSGDAPIQMLTFDPETLGPETAPQEALSTEIARQGRGASRVIVDIATASGATTRRVLRMGPTALVPVVPDMSSVVSVGAIDTFFQRNSGSAGQPAMPFYVLNQFDPSLPLHLDVREVLREQLGDRLLPFSLRRMPAVSEALAEGMTVMDYAPNSTVAEDFGALAGWVKSLAAPATNGFRGVRWSER